MMTKLRADDGPPGHPGHPGHIFWKVVVVVTLGHVPRPSSGTTLGLGNVDMMTQSSAPLRIMIRASGTNATIQFNNSTSCHFSGFGTTCVTTYCADSTDTGVSDILENSCRICGHVFNAK